MSVLAPPKLDLEAIAEEVRRLAPNAPYSEVVQGVRFVVHPPTPFLDRVVTRTVEVLRSALARSARPSSVLRTVPMVAGYDSVVVPDVLVRDEEPESQQVTTVVVVRSHSTDRYAMGPQRLAFQTAQVEEYWYLDPFRGLLRVLRLDHSTKAYGWPPVTYDASAEIDLHAFAPAVVNVGDLVSVDVSASALRFRELIRQGGDHGAGLYEG